MSIPILNESLIFPPLSLASEQGLVAIGGDLGAERLMLAYRSGIFPWFNDDSLILWWSPDSVSRKAEGFKKHEATAS